MVISDYTAGQLGSPAVTVSLRTSLGVQPEHYNCAERRRRPWEV